MKRNTIAALALATTLATFLTGCGKSDTPAAGTGTPASPSMGTPAMAGVPTHESIRMQALPKMQSLIEVFKSVKDEASAKAAVPKMEAIGKEFVALKAADDALPKMTATEEEAFDKKIGPQMKSTGQDMEKEMARIATLPPTVSAPIMAAMKSLESQIP